MMRRNWLTRAVIPLGTFFVSTIAFPAAADAQIVRVTGADYRHAIGVNLGYFMVRGEDGRAEGDVLRANLPDLQFEISDFNGATFGGEWLYGVSDYLEAGVGLGFYRRTVPSVYREFVDTDGSEIEQDLRLRIVPITATVRFLPVGRGGSVEPYVGAGLGIFNWRYTETGEFIDFSDFTIFRQSYRANGNAVGPVVLAGLRAPVGDVWRVGGEIRWQRAEGDTDRLQTQLLGDRIDLGGWNIGFTVQFRF